MKEKLLKIINNYGVIPQLKYLQSEVFEFNEAIIRNDELEKCYYDNYGSNYLKEARKHIIEEFADLMVMLEQFKAYYNLSNEDIMETMKYKIERQLKRIEEENKR